MGGRGGQGGPAGTQPGVDCPPESDIRLLCGVHASSATGPKEKTGDVSLFFGSVGFLFLSFLIFPFLFAVM